VQPGDGSPVLHARVTCDNSRRHARVSHRFGAISAVASGTVHASTSAVSPKVDPTRHNQATLPLTGIRVVVVDDTAEARELTAYLLRCQGADVVDASTAADALSLVMTTWPDVLVSDVAMPGEDGYSLIRQVRALPGALGLTPVIALTAFDDAEDRRYALCAGFDVLLSKTVTIAVVVRAIRHLTIHRAMRARRIVAPS